MEANVLGIYRDDTAEAGETKNHGLSVFADCPQPNLARLLHTLSPENLLEIGSGSDAQDGASTFGDHGQSFSEFPPSAGGRFDHAHLTR